MIPMVGTPAEAEHIVACTRYPPHGRRGAAFGFAHDDYEGGEVAAKIAALHERTLVIAQDRKSTRLNSSHTVSSYAVLCLKKKTPRRTRYLPWPPDQRDAAPPPRRPGKRHRRTAYRRGGPLRQGRL